MQRLTKAQAEILAQVAQGKTSRQIATQMQLSPRTVENHRAAICQRLGLRGSNALLRFAVNQAASARAQTGAAKREQAPGRAPTPLCESQVNP